MVTLDDPFSAISFSAALIKASRDASPRDIFVSIVFNTKPEP
jgi:hypothetical protein